MRLLFRTMNKYVITTDPDDHREGTVVLGGHEDDHTGEWTGGQHVMKWTHRQGNGGRPPKRIERLVETANRVISAINTINGAE